MSRSYRWWTFQDVLYVQSHCLKMSDIEIGKAIDRTPESIRRQRRLLGMVNMRAPILPPRPTAPVKHKLTWQGYQPSHIAVEPLDGLIKHVNLLKRVYGTWR